MRRLAAVILICALAAPLAAQARTPKPEAVFKAWDKNADGVITVQEWALTKRPAKQFPLVDTDNDGKVTLEELRIAMAKMKADGGH
jgi:Ca2+-binding EF-hand superfamily protein